MKVVKLTKHVHSSANKGIVDFLTIFDDLGVEVRFKLSDRLEERGLTVRKCSELTGLRLGTISDLMNGNKTSVTFQHIGVLMIVLAITDINDLIEVHFPDHLKEALNYGAEVWKETKEPCQGTLLTSKLINGEVDNPEEYLNFLKERIAYLEKKKEE